MVRLALLLVINLFLAGCVSQTVKSTQVPAVKTAAEVVPEELLLDVGVAVFDPGLEGYEEKEGVERVYPEVRRAEALYMPNLMAEAIQQSGAWGAVRVVPSSEQITDVMVQSTILKSNGEELELQVQATDSRGYTWLDKKYSGKASRYAYDSTTRMQVDPFQAVYNNIANDLLDQLQSLRPEDRRNNRLVTELLFARSFSPDAFDGYLQQNRKDVWLVMRLPAEGDPMLERVRGIQERDHLFVDTMQGHYETFGYDMVGPYQEWRKLSYEEVVALKELKAESTRRLIAGGVAVLAGIAAAGSSDGYSRSAGNVAIIGGGYLLKSGLEQRAEAQIHIGALEELGMSLEAEIAPQVIELEDRTVTLSGNVEDQYAQWRALLAEIYRAEIGSLEPLAADPEAADTLPD
ncbi:MAG: hypothetical protein AAGI11_06095 [Pseudomonadota bacterium]